MATKLDANKFTYGGHGLAGWSLSPTGGHDYEDQDTVTLTSDTKLYAVWARQYSITVNNVEHGNLTPAKTSYLVSNRLQMIKLSITPGEGYFLSGVALTDSGNESAYYEFHSLFIPMNSEGDIVITPSFDTKPASVDYMDVTWSSSVLVTIPKQVTDFSLVRANNTSWSTGYYVLWDDVIITDRITVTGDVKLILRDEKTLKADKGITVQDGATLTIYGQTISDAGRLEINGDSECAGIGGTSNSDCGTVEIKGGVIEVTGGSDSAGIGGGYEGNGGTVNIYMGTVTAKGGVNAAGIGGGYAGSGGTVNIYGGRVTAEGSLGGAGIGGGYGRAGADVSIYGGKLSITGGSGEIQMSEYIHCKAIGAGYYCDPVDDDKALNNYIGDMLETRGYDETVWHDYDGTRLHQIMTVNY